LFENQSALINEGGIYQRVDAALIVLLIKPVNALKT